MAKAKKDLAKLIETAKTQHRASYVWKGHEKGDAIAGTVKKMRWLPGKGKDDKGIAIPYLCITIEDEDGRLIVHPCGVVLTQEIEDQEVKKGDTIAIVYMGKEGRTGIYSLAIDRE